MNELTAALYRVTDRMESDEPLKWHLRKCALRLSELYGKEPQTLSFREEEEGRGLIADMLRMLELASSLSYVSRVNFDVLMREYLPLEKTKEIESKKEKEESSEKSPEPQPALAETVTVSERQKRVLEYLETKENSSIGELMVLFQDTVSEKTIQRDLNDLMIQGKVRAEGDKRWRRYSIFNGK